MKTRLVFEDYEFLARHQVRKTRPNGMMLFLLDAVRDLMSDSPRSVLLDVGGGTNSYLTFLESRHQAIICDAAQTSVEGLIGVETIVASLPRTGLPTGMADWVSACEIIEHLPPETYQEGLKEIARLSRRYVVITSPFLQHLQSGDVRCRQCGAIYQCEGHFRRFAMKDVHGLQEQLGGMVRFGFFKHPQSLRSAMLRYHLRQARQYLRGIGILAYAKPPFTKCPACGLEEFHAYEAHRRSAAVDDMRAWQVSLPFDSTQKVGNHFIAIFDKTADPVVGPVLSVREGRSE